MEIPPQHNSGAICQTEPLGFDQLGLLAKQIELCAILRTVFIGGGQMGQEDIDIQPFKQRRCELLGTDTQAVDPAIKHDVAPPATCRAPQGDLLWRIQDGNGTNLSNVRDVVRRDAVENRYPFRRHQV